MNSCNTDIFFSNYYHLQSVRFELELCVSINISRIFLDGWPANCVLSVLE